MGRRSRSQTPPLNSSLPSSTTIAGTWTNARLHDDKEINPDVLGYIFEKYINQKQMGAYYTKEDITGYISIIPILPSFWIRPQKDAGSLLKEIIPSGSHCAKTPTAISIRRYKGAATLPLPPEIEAG